MGGTSYATFTSAGGGGGGGGGSTTFFQESPTGTVDGANTAFVLPHTPTAPANVSLYLDGGILYQGTDYTISGTAITMTVAPVVNQTLWAVYS